MAQSRKGQWAWDRDPPHPKMTQSGRMNTQRSRLSAENHMCMTGSASFNSEPQVPCLPHLNPSSEWRGPGRCVTTWKETPPEGELSTPAELPAGWGPPRDPSWHHVKQNHTSNPQNHKKEETIVFESTTLGVVSFVAIDERVTLVHKTTPTLRCHSKEMGENA